MLFTDVESSTELARTLGPRWREVLAAHHAIVGGAIEAEHGWAAFPPPRTESSRPTNLPASSTVLIGRDHELDHVRTAIAVDRERLVTLTGRGGSGKTSLALASAAELLDAFPDGVWLARLANLSPSADVAEAIASAVGATRTPSRSWNKSLAAAPRRSR